MMDDIAEAIHQNLLMVAYNKYKAEYDLGSRSLPWEYLSDDWRAELIEEVRYWHGALVPEGTVNVPRETTDAMVKAAYDAQQKALAECEAPDCGSDHLRAAINAAMLSVVE